MCFPFDAEPPIPPIAGAAIDTRDLTLQSADGSRFAAFAAHGGAPGSPGVVVLPDVRGLFHFYEELAVRFAEQGMDSVAIDYFGRTAGVSKRGEDFPYMDYIPRTRGDEIAADVRAAIDYLRQGQGNATRPLFTVGFCFGGSASWLQAAYGHGLRGVIGFYGQPTQGRNGAPAPIDRVADYECPVLALMGGADTYIPPDVIAQFTAALTRAGVAHEVHSYAGAPHSFFDRAYEQFAADSADAWERVLRFIRSHA